MPEIVLTIELPDGKALPCYSPSTIIRSHFQVGETLTVHEFVQRSRVAFAAASERVRARYGFACTAAAGQLAEIEAQSSLYAGDAEVRILSIA
jgi:uncharacterized repeat protein (TIGR04042 family)